MFGYGLIDLAAGKEVGWRGTFAVVVFSIRQESLFG
jgi:hypothetical protein